MATVINEVKLPIYDINIKVYEDGTKRMKWQFDDEARLSNIKKSIIHHVTDPEWKFEDHKEEETARIQCCVERELEVIKKSNEMPRKLERDVMYARIDSSNLKSVTADVSEDYVNFDVYVDFREYRYTFSVSKEFVKEFMQSKPSLFPNAYNDLSRWVSFPSYGIEVSPTRGGIESGSIDTYLIEIRDNELKEMFEHLLSVEVETEKHGSRFQKVDVTPFFKKSKELSIPNVTVHIAEGAFDVIRDEDNVIHGLHECMEHVTRIASNSSNGVEDPVELTFYKDSEEHSLYWNIIHINSGKRVMNGGIIWHNHRNEYGIHT